MAKTTEADGPTTRRCVVTGALLPKSRLVRFVRAPEGDLVPDIDGSLPGRGIWISAEREIVERASKAHRVRGAAGSAADTVAGLLAGRCLSLLGLARRAGLVASGTVQVRAALAKGAVALLSARDGAAGGRDKLRRLAAHTDVTVIELFDQAELAPALGRDSVVHVALGRGRLSNAIIAEAGRLAGFRDGSIGQAGSRCTAQESDGA